MENNELNIEKLDFEELLKEHTPYTTVLNKVVQQITDHFAGFIWVYLSTLPPKWKVNKYHLMKHFDIGEQKYKKHMAYLHSVGLIEYKQKRNKDGTLGKVCIKVMCGNNFKDMFKDDTNSTDDTTGMKNHPAVSPPSGESSTYKNNIKERKEKEITTTETPTIVPPESDHPTEHESSSVVVIFDSQTDEKIKRKLEQIPQADKTSLQLLKEIYFHVQKNYPNNKWHGINAALKLLREGVWTTPGGYVDQQAIDAEKARIKAEQEFVAEQRRIEGEKQHNAYIRSVYEKNGQTPPDWAMA